MGSASDDLLGMDAWIYLAMGGFILTFALMTLALTGFMSLLLWFCVFGGIAPSSIVVLYGVYRWRVERHLRALARMAQSYRRIHLDELARRMGKTRFETEHRLADAVHRGYVKGFVDRSSDEFVVQEAVAQQVYVGMCPTCGARVDRWGFPEERLVCPYCRAGINVPAANPR